MKIVARILKLEPGDINPTSAFKDMGVDSILAVEIVSEINRQLKIELRATELFNYPTIINLGEFILNNNEIGVFTESGESDALITKLEKRPLKPIQCEKSRNDMADNVHEIDEIILQKMLKKVETGELDFNEAAIFIDELSNSPNNF
jgi:acyl carrier protein